MTSEYPSSFSALSQPTLSLDFDEIIAQLSKPSWRVVPQLVSITKPFPLALP
jgi:serine O-acetyltransferase